MTYRCLLEKTVVPSSLSAEEKRKLYDPLLTQVHQMLPTRLYRFRSCSERNIDAFLNDKLFFSNGSSVNDDFDARLSYSKEQIHRWLNALVSDNGYQHFINQLTNMQETPDQFDSIIPNFSQIVPLIFSMSKSDLQNLMFKVISCVKEDLDVSLNDITIQIQSHSYFACFTENIYSSMMWGHYANNSTGFALEYRFTPDDVVGCTYNSNGQIAAYCDLLPITYSNYRIDATSYAIYLFQIQFLKGLIATYQIPLSAQWINTIVPCPDEAMPLKIALRKSPEWKPEKEWRMFYMPTNTSLIHTPHPSVKKVPSAIYLGRKISPLNQKILVDFAKEKGLPVFKMAISDNSRSYTLQADKL